jgi:hypothetical protein
MLFFRTARRRCRDIRAKLKLRKEFFAYRQKAGNAHRFPAEWEHRWLIYRDKTPTTEFDRHYIYHTAWAARILARTKPAVHVDIGSYLFFPGIVSAFVPVRFYDYRPADLKLSQLESGFADLMSLDFQDNSVQSLSCLHTVEHIGLGRYGDPIDPDGDLRAMSELQRVLAQGGQLLFVVPVGRRRLQFNAHRVYAYRDIVSYFPSLSLEEFALVPDDPTQSLLINPSESISDQQTYGCGCFLFRKPQL